VLGLGQGLTNGAFWIVAVLICRSRVKAYLLSALMAFALYMVEIMLAGIIVLVVGGIVLIIMLLTGLDTPKILDLIGFICSGVIFLVAHLFLVNMLLPARLMRYAAREMDHQLLQSA